MHDLIGLLVYLQLFADIDAGFVDGYIGVVADEV